MSPWVFRPLELVQRLNEAEVRFVIVGGLAVGAWGYVRGTDDVDIVPDPSAENLERLAIVLEELGGRVVIREHTLDPSGREVVKERKLTPPAIRTFLRTGDKTLVRTEIGEVDVLQGLPQIPRFAELAPRAKQTELEGVSMLVCSMEDLLAMKRAANRPEDQIDIRALEIAHSEEGEEEKG